MFEVYDILLTCHYVLPYPHHLDFCSRARLGFSAVRLHPYGHYQTIDYDGHLYSEAETQPPLKEASIVPDFAVGAGYSESKWVSEQILQIAASKTSLQPVIIRVGQLSGGLNGAWNVVEWIPALIKSSICLGVLPDCDGVRLSNPLIAIFASNDGADRLSLGSHSTKQLVQLPTSGAQTHKLSILSIQNQFLGLTYLLFISIALDLPLVPYVEWLGKLQHSASDHEMNAATEMEILRYNPALRTLPFFQSLGAYAADLEPGWEALHFPALSIENALSASPTLYNVSPLGEQDVLRWLTYWKAVGYL